MKLPIPTIIFGLILCITIAVRFYQLNNIPYGLTWDEASIVYNAWGISLWNRDEYATRLPLAFRSFGDYKAPLMFYLLAIPYKVFGLHIGLIRIYSATAGVFAVAGIYLIAHKIADDLDIHTNEFSLIAAFLAALSPWAIQMSRVGYEANLALALITWGVYFLILNTSKKSLITSSILLALSMYAYHSAKIVVPLLLIFYWFTQKRELYHQLKAKIASWLIFIVGVSPLIFASIFGSANARATTTIFYTLDGRLNSIWGIISTFVNNVIHLFSFNFWIGGIDAIGLRHLVPGFGIMYFTTFGFFLLGIAYLLIKKPKQSSFIFAWLLVGLLPSLITYDSPHAIRTLLALPPIILISAVGIQPLKRFFEQISTLDYIYFAIVVMIVSVNAFLYLHTYYGSYAVDSAADFQYGYKQAFEAIREYGKDDQKIILTDTYGQPYIYALLYQKIKPQEYLYGALANFEFRKIDDWKQADPNYLYVGTPEEISPKDPHVVQLIKVPQSEKIAFVVAELQ